MTVAWRVPAWAADVEEQFADRMEEADADFFVPDAGLLVGADLDGQAVLVVHPAGHPVEHLDKAAVLEDRRIDLGGEGLEGIAGLVEEHVHLLEKPVEAIVLNAGARQPCAEFAFRQQSLQLVVQLAGYAVPLLLLGEAELASEATQLRGQIGNPLLEGLTLILLFVFDLLVGGDVARGFQDVFGAVLVAQQHHAAFDGQLPAVGCAVSQLADPAAVAQQGIARVSRGQRMLRLKQVRDRSVGRLLTGVAVEVLGALVPVNDWPVEPPDKDSLGHLFEQCCPAFEHLGARRGGTLGIQWRVDRKRLALRRAGRLVGHHSHTHSFAASDEEPAVAAPRAGKVLIESLHVVTSINGMPVATGFSRGSDAETLRGKISRNRLAARLSGRR